MERRAASADVMFKCATTTRSARSARSARPATWLSVINSPAGDDPPRWTSYSREVFERRFGAGRLQHASGTPLLSSGEITLLYGRFDKPHRPHNRFHSI